MAKQPQRKKTKTAQALLPQGSDRPTPEEASRNAAQATSREEKRGPGRPPKEDKPENMKRTSISMDREQMDRLKVAAAIERRHVYELIGDAVEAYLQKVGQ